MKKQILLSLLVAILALSSCNIYNPTFINSPIYEEVGEVNATAMVGSNQSVNLSTNPIEHFSIIVNANTTGALTNEESVVVNPNNSVEPYYYSLYQLEAGLGYYYKLTEDIQHDLYLGYGFGKAGEEEGYYVYQADQRNFFIQSSLSYRMDKTTQAILSSKFNRLSYTNFNFTTTFDDNYYINNPFAQRPEDPIFNNRDYWVNQFGIGFISNLGPIELILQAQLIARFSQNFNSSETSPLAGFIGINFKIDEITRKDK